MSRSWTRKLVRIAQTPWVEKRLALTVCRQLLVVRKLLSRRPLPTALEAVSRTATERPTRTTGGVDADCICLWVRRCADHLPGSYACLAQALAGYVVCRRYGFEPELRVGVTRPAAPSPPSRPIPAGSPSPSDASGESELLAHAWLELNGRVVLGDLPNLARYRVFERSEALLRSAQSP